MRYLRQSTAVTFRAGPFVDSTDGVTPETGLTIAQADIQISKNGGAFAQTSATTPTTTHDQGGWYQCPLTTTDTNTLGKLTVEIQMAGALPVWVHFEVVPAFVYDALFGTWASNVVYGNPQAVTDGANLRLPSGAISADNNRIGSIVAVVAGTGAGQSPQYIRDSTAADDSVVLDPGFGTAPNTSSTIIVMDAPANPTTSVPGVDVLQISGDATAANNLESAYDGTGYDLGGIDVSELNQIVDDWINGGRLDLLIDAITTHLTDIKGGTFSGATDSLEAIRDRGDSAWITGGGGGLTQALNVQPVLPYSIDLANTATVRLGLVLVNALDDLPSTAEITPGTISIDRKAAGGTSWSSVVSDAAMSEQAGMVYYDEVFDSGTGYAAGDSIRVTFKSVSITADSNTHEVVGAAGIIFQTVIRESVPTAVANADALLGRNIDGGSSSGRLVKEALKRLRNKVSISGSIMTVTDEDDATTAWTASLSTSASQDPITGVDPS